ncbi:DUF1615 family protein [Shigella flexneri]
MPASVKDRSAWADALATTFKSQTIAPLRRICSVLAVAQQESNDQSHPAVPGLSKSPGRRLTAGPNDAHPGFSGAYRP